jgi:outer membrane protein insertion porin family
MRTRLVALFLLLISVSLAFAQQRADDWYVGKPIKDITFDGLKHVKASELEGVIQPYIGRLFKDDLFWELQGRLYALEYFDVITPSAVPANPEGSAVIIKFTVTEKPVVSKINFEGNKGLRRNELLDVITIKTNDVVNQIKQKADEQAIRNKYMEKGYPDVKVTSDTKKNKDGSVDLTFTIQEGEKITVDAIRFEGNTAFSEKTLRGILSLKTKSLFNDGAYQEAKLNADKNTVVQYYQERGYIDAAVTDVVKEIHKDAQGHNLVTITFRIHEGKVYIFDGISFEGNKIFSTEKLSALVYSKSGQIINGKKLEADFQRIADLYYENGYIFNTISHREIRNEAEGKIAYLVSIVERDRAHIENIIIRGNKKTKDSVILREIPLETGDIFSKTKVLDGMRNLYNLQYFSSVTPETPPGSADNLMNLVFNVEEQPTADIQFGLTFSGTSTPDAFPISGLVKWNDRNFLGQGNIFGVEVNGSPDTQSVSVQYTQRWMLGLPLSGGFDFTAKHTALKALMDSSAPFFNGDETYAYPDGFNTYQEYIDAAKTPADEYLMKYDQWNLSVGFSTGYRFTTAYGNLNLGGGIRSGLILNSYDATLYRPFDPTLRAGNNLWTPANSVWTSVALDNRDVYYDPSRGYYGIQRVGYYGILPFELEHYVKTDTKAEYFHTLFEFPLTDNFKFKTVFGIHSGLSFIFPQWFNGEPKINSTNMLAIDGMFTARGWYSERLNYGLALWENWAELRTPLVPGVLAWDWFIDAAAVKDTPQHFFQYLEPEDFRFSLGGGFRFTIPQFPFRFSLAKRFKIVNGAVEWQAGGIGHSASDPTSGLDFVISFALSTY